MLSDELSLWISPFAVALGILAAAAVYSRFWLKSSESAPISNIPTFNPFPFAGSHVAGLLFYFQSRKMIFEGYKKYRSGVFKVPRWSTGWAVIITGERLVDEFHKLPDDVCSFVEAANEEMHVSHTMGLQVHSNPYHLSILKANLNRHLDYLVSEILDEATLAFEDVIGQKCSDDWKEFNVNENFTKILPRIFHRVLVGAPLCRNSKFTEIACRFTVRAYVTSVVINFFPMCIRQLLGRILGQASSFQKEAAIYLQPLIEERMQMMRDCGSSWNDKPNDVLMWLLDELESKDDKFDSADLQSRILTVNFATTHTSSYTFIQALLNMASRPQCLERCVLEAEEGIRTHGWTREGINSLALLDSFFKESMRMNSLGSMSLPRKMVKAVTLTDGTQLPVGSFVSASFATHFDEKYYKDPQTFDAFRFVDKTRVRVNNAMAMTSSRYLPFGHGAHVCPGRFLVAYGLKALMAHILLHYDLKLGGDGLKKPDFWFSFYCAPNPSATVVIRRRTM